MNIYISGFLPGNDSDDAIKYELDILPIYEEGVMKILNWTSLKVDGELLLTFEQIASISSVIKEDIPKNLDVFVGVQA